MKIDRKVDRNVQNWKFIHLSFSTSTSGRFFGQYWGHFIGCTIAIELPPCCTAGVLGAAAVLAVVVVTTAAVDDIADCQASATEVLWGDFG